MTIDSRPAANSRAGSIDQETRDLLHELNNALLTVLINTEFVASAAQVPQVRVDAAEAQESARAAVSCVRRLTRHLQELAGAG